MNHYERLGVDRDATPSELRRAYRKLASRHHPDRNGDDVEGATRKMVELNEAFDVLSDPVKRFDYNRSLDRAAERRPAGQGSTAGKTTRRSQQSPSAPPPADDPVRRARREAKERAAAAARKRGYRPPGPSGGMDFSAPK